MKKRFLVFAVLATGFLLLVGVVLVLRRQGGKPPVPSTPLPALEIPSPLPRPVSVHYTLSAPLPEVFQLPVYRFSPFGGADPQKWAKDLGFGGEPQEVEDALRGTLYLWTENGKTLTIDENASYLLYTVDLLANPATLSGSFLPTDEQAQAIVERTLQDLTPELRLWQLEPRGSRALRVGAAQMSECLPDRADLLEVRFGARIGNYSLYLSHAPLSDLVLAWVGRDGKLLRLEYHPVGTLGEKIGDYPVKDEEELLKDLEGGKGVVVSSGLEGGEEIASVIITRVELGYLLPSPEATTIQPIFVLSGQARTAEGKTGAVTVYLPAVEE